MRRSPAPLAVPRAPSPWGPVAAVVLAATGCRSAPAAERRDSSQGHMEGEATFAPSPRTVPCGAMHCLQYDSAAEAFRDVVALHPLALGIGEAHAPRGASVPSAARRFSEQLLPLLAGRASDLLVELMLPPASCRDAAAQVRTQQQVVTSAEAEANEADYLAMGDRARSLAIVPDVLRPSCADLDAMRGADADAVDAALTTIARLTGVQAKRLVMRDASSDADRGKMVVVYGGALHNDLNPPPADAAYSYAPALDEAVGGRFVSLDLIVPEFIRDDETWNMLPWRAAYDAARLGDKPTLLRTGERSFVLVFARTGS